MNELNNEVVRPKITLKKFFGHLHTVNKHRWIVFKLCCRCGIPFRGMIHDLSKYSYDEFFESVRYYTGTHSPISDCKKNEGYSKAWLHHSGRNKHHFEYWYEYLSPNPTPIIPYKYTVEMICDNMAAGMAYQGKNWTKEYQLGYWNMTNSKKDIKMNQANKDILTDVFTLVASEGLKVINKNTLRFIYDRHVYGDNEANDEKVSALIKSIVTSKVDKATNDALDELDNSNEIENNETNETKE